jgi:RNA polymerase sigma-70 factor (ECF subfamily)
VLVTGNEPGPVPEGRVDLAAWVDAARGGDEDAFATLYTAVQPGLLRYLYALVGQDAEDVAAEAWLQIARDLRSYRGDGGGFAAWAVSIARHRAIDHLRCQSRRPARPVDADLLAQLSDPQDTAERAVDAVATYAAIALIATLPREQAEAVLLRVVVGLDAHGAARVLGKRPGAVRTAAYRGLRRLAHQLDHNAPAADAIPARPVGGDTPATPPHPAGLVTKPGPTAPRGTR